MPATVALLLAAAQAGLGGRAARLHGLDEETVLRRKLEKLGGGAGHRLRGDAQEGVLAPCRSG
jgi:hypothetical protein